MDKGVFGGSDRDCTSACATWRTSTVLLAFPSAEFDAPTCVLRVGWSPVVAPPPSRLRPFGSTPDDPSDPLPWTEKKLSQVSIHGTQWDQERPLQLGVRVGRWTKAQWKPPSDTTIAMRGTCGPRKNPCG